MVDYQIHHLEGLNNSTFNVGGGHQVSVSLCELTEFCRKITGNKIQIESVPENRQADIRIYVTDNSKIKAATGWSPEIGVGEILEDIYRWLKENENSLQYILK